MKKQSYHYTLAEIFPCSQHQAIASVGDSIALMVEEGINIALLDMKKRSFLVKEFYQKLCSTGAQSARLSGLSKLHRKGSFTPNIVYRELVITT